MGSVSMKLKVQGLEALLKKLAKLEQKACNDALKKATNQATQIVAADQKDMIRSLGLVITGQMWRSVGRRVRMYKKTTWVGIVGPRVVPSFAVPKATGTGIHDPSKIAHLVEFGHGGPAPAPEHPWMRPARALSERKVYMEYVNAVAAALR